MGQHSEAGSVVLRRDDYQARVRPYIAHKLRGVLKLFSTKFLFPKLIPTLLFERLSDHCKTEKERKVMYKINMWKQLIYGCPGPNLQTRQEQNSVPGYAMLANLCICEDSLSSCILRIQRNLLLKYGTSDTVYLKRSHNYLWIQTIKYVFYSWFQSAHMSTSHEPINI